MNAVLTFRMSSLCNAQCSGVRVNAVGDHSVEDRRVVWQSVAGQQADQMWIAMVKLHNDAQIQFLLSTFSDVSNYAFACSASA